MAGKILNYTEYLVITFYLTSERCGKTWRTLYRLSITTHLQSLHTTGPAESVADILPDRMVSYAGRFPRETIYILADGRQTSVS